MKIYWLRLDQTNLSYNAFTGKWTSSAIDLYDNSVYTNYTTTKTDFGLNLTNPEGDITIPSVWTGILDEGGGVTEAGYVKNGYFVDTVSRIDIVSYVLSDDLPDESASRLLDIYTVESPSFSSDMGIPYEGIPRSSEIGITSSQRYAYFMVDYTNLDGLHANPVVHVRIQIGIPAISVISTEVKKMLNNYPEWMAIRELDTGVTNRHLAVPMSLGGKFVNVIGADLDYADKKLRWLRDQYYIDTVDLSQPAWVYRIENIPDYYYSILVDGKQIPRTFDSNEFFFSLPNEDICLIHEPTRTIYFRKYYDTITVNTLPFTSSPFHIWNVLDEFGMLVGVPRLYLESNINYKARIKDFYINRAGVGKDNFKKALRRDLDLWRISS